MIRHTSPTFYSITSPQNLCIHLPVTYFQFHGTTFHFGSRAFCIPAPKIWNSLSPHILQSQTLSLFRHHLKTQNFQVSVSLSCPLPPIPNAPRFSSETLALYKSLSSTLTLQTDRKTTLRLAILSQHLTVRSTWHTVTSYLTERKRGKAGQTVRT